MAVATIVAVPMEPSSNSCRTVSPIWNSVVSVSHLDILYYLLKFSTGGNECSRCFLQAPFSRASWIACSIGETEIIHRGCVLGRGNQERP